MGDKKINNSLRSGGRLWIAALLVAVLTFIIYLPALQNDFVNWDDHRFIYENRHITKLDSEFIRWAFTDREMQWSPLRWLSHAVDYKIWKLNPMGHHLSNVLLHGLNTFLVVVLVIGIFRAVEAQRLPSPAQGEDKGFWRRAFISGIITGLFFGLHPLRVESVAWVSARKDVLYAFFFLLSLILYLRYVSFSGGKRSKYYYILCLLCFIMALISKAMAVTLPFVLILLDVYPLKRLNTKSGGSVLLEKVPFFGLSLVLITVMVHEKIGAVTPLKAATYSERILVAFKSLSFYLLKTIWPGGLSPFYPYPKSISYLSFEYLFSIVLVAVISIFCIMAWKKGWKVFLAVWSFYVITLLPILGIIHVGSQVVADRYAYIASMGPFLLIGLGMSVMWERTYDRGRSLLLNRKLIIIVSVLIVALLSILTIRQIRVWSNSITLWTHELEKYPDEEIAYINRSAGYVDSGDYMKALKDLDRSIALNPDFKEAYIHRGIVYYALEKNQDAIKDFSRAIELNPAEARTYSNRGTVYVKLGSLQQAIGDFDRAIELNPEDAEAYNNRGNTYADSGDNQQAIRDFSRAIELDPEFAMAYSNRGVSYGALGNYQQAIKDFDRAIELNPGGSKAYNNRGISYGVLGNYQQAIRDFDRAIELDPEVPETYNNRGLAFKASGEFKNAITDYSKAILLNPGHSMYYYNRGAVYLSTGKNDKAIRDFQKSARLGDKRIQELLNAKGIKW